MLPILAQNINVLKEHKQLILMKNKKPVVLLATIQMISTKDLRVKCQKIGHTKGKY
jgi:hypothetical protein